MALGRQGETHDELMMGWAEMPRSPGHVFYDRLQEVLTASELVPARFSNTAGQAWSRWVRGRRVKGSLRDRCVRLPQSNRRCYTTPRGVISRSRT